MTDASGTKIHAEIARIMAETLELNKSIRWFEVVILTAMVVVGIAIAKLLL